MELCTKQDFETQMNTLLNPLKPLYSTGGARLRLGVSGTTYAKDAQELEAFSRPLWALAPFWAGGGHSEEFEKIYKKGLVNGSNPVNREYWGGFTDYDQRFVEMAAIACGLMQSPQVLWEPLSQSERQGLAAWLSGINDFFIPDCNWQFFRVLVNVALKKLNMPYSAEKLTQSLAKVEEYYMDDGWYQDGASCQKDYYIPFAMHYYGLVYAKFMQQEDGERCGRFKNRAIRFAQDFIYWFSDTGAALPFGRSLAYRFAEVSFWSACLFAGIEPFSLGVMKGIISRHFNYWADLPIKDRDGILTVGYAYPNLIMAERYNAPGSPYWGMKAFLFLALPSEHPFWSTRALPLPQLEKIKPLYAADMLMHRRGKEVTAYTPGVCELYGHGHLVEKYSKFAYSTSFGFSVARSNFVLHEACPDSMLAFVEDGDDTVFVRKRCMEYTISQNDVYSLWSPCKGIVVKTTITPTEQGHHRRHEITSERECTAYDCGFAVQKFCEGYIETAQNGEAAVQNSQMGCTVKSVDHKGEAYLIGADPNTNILWENTNIPAIKYRINKGLTVIETQVEAFV